MKYYPTLLAKTGELKALQELSSQVKAQVSPILKLQNLKSNGAVEVMLTNHWSFLNNQIIFDFAEFENLNDSLPQVDQLFDTLINSGVNCIPVVQVNSSASYLSLVQKWVAKYSRPVAVKISNQSGGFSNVDSQVSALSNQLSIPVSSIILLIDLGEISTNSLQALIAAGLLSLRVAFDFSPNWLDVVIISGCFPQNLSDLAANRVHRLPRLEWQLWRSISSEYPNIKYGDYGTKSPVTAVGSFPGTSSIKYTAENEYLILRGELPKNHPRGMHQYIDKAIILVGEPEYSGSTFSWGDLRIDAISKSTRNPGNPTSWVQISQNHHITLLASLL